MEFIAIYTSYLIKCVSCCTFTTLAYEYTKSICKFVYTRLHVRQIVNDEQDQIIGDVLDIEG